jgi:hypothetical protein
MSKPRTMTNTRTKIKFVDCGLTGKVVINKRNGNEVRIRRWEAYSCRECGDSFFITSVNKPKQAKGWNFEYVTCPGGTGCKE